MTEEKGSAPEPDSGQTDNAARTDRQVVAFRLSGETFGVDIGAVREIIRLQTVTHLPSAPDAVAGVINLRGGVVPVVDLSKRLNLGSAAETDESRIIVLDIGDSDIASSSMRSRTRCASTRARSSPRRPSWRAVIPPTSRVSRRSKTAC